MVPFPSSEDKRQNMLELVDDQGDNASTNNGQAIHNAMSSNELDVDPCVAVADSEFFDKFVHALEQHGPSRRWDKIALDLNVSINDAKVYAYRYLQEIEKISNSNKDNNIGQVVVSDTGANDSSWSNEEKTLFFTLIATQCDLGSLGMNDDEYWEGIASMMPGRSAQECRMYYSNKKK